jgi:hypothetical protein
MLNLTETEIHKITDDSKIKRQTNLDRRGPRPIPLSFATFPTPLLSRYRLPLKEQSAVKFIVIKFKGTVNGNSVILVSGFTITLPFLLFTSVTVNTVYNTYTAL